MTEAWCHMHGISVRLGRLAGLAYSTLFVSGTNIDVCIYIFDELTDLIFLFLENLAHALLDLSLCKIMYTCTRIRLVLRNLHISVNPNHQWRNQWCTKKAYAADFILVIYMSPHGFFNIFCGGRTLPYSL